MARLKPPVMDNAYHAPAGPAGGGLVPGVPA
jgi:hypothetical protein